MVSASAKHPTKKGDCFVRINWDNGFEGKKDFDERAAGNSEIGEKLYKGAVFLAMAACFSGRNVIYLQIFFDILNIV